MKDISENSGEKIYIEGMTSVSALINACRAGTNRRDILEVYFDKNKTHSDFRRFRFLSAASAELGFRLSTVGADMIEEISTGRTHGGIIASVTSSVYPELSQDEIKKNGFAVLMEGLEDPYSLGNSIRTLYACGADMLILPHRLPDGADTVIARSSAGTSEILPIFVSDPVSAAELFKINGYKIVGAGIRDSVESFEADLSRPVLLVVGGEKRGLSSALSDKCDFMVRIPYGRDFMGSLSSSSSVAILAYEVLRNNRNK